MVYRPKDTGHTPEILSVLLLIMAAAGYIAGSMAERFAWLFQLICIGGVVGAL